MVLDCPGLFQTIVVSSGLTFGLFSRVFVRFRCCLKVLARFRWFLPVWNTYGGFGMVPGGSVRRWMVRACSRR